MLITPAYAQLNREKHEASTAYGTSGAQWAKQVLQLARELGFPDKIVTVLDYGSGKGTLKQALSATSLEIGEYDPAIPDKSEPPMPADVVVCTDVLEHIEPECLYAVLDDIRRVALRAVILTVATKPANKHLSDGRNAHLIVEPVTWWLPKLMDRWRMKSFGDFECGFAFVGQTL